MKLEFNVVATDDGSITLICNDSRLESNVEIKLKHGAKRTRVISEALLEETREEDHWQSIKSDVENGAFERDVDGVNNITGTVTGTAVQMRDHNGDLRL